MSSDGRTSHIFYSLPPLTSLSFLMLLLFSLLPVPSSFFHRDAVTNYHLSEYKKELERVEKATPEERRKMEEELVLRPQAVGAKQRRKRFEASSSDSMISEMSLSAATSKECEQRIQRTSTYLTETNYP